MKIVTTASLVQPSDIATAQAEFQVEYSREVQQAVCESSLAETPGDGDMLSPRQWTLRPTRYNPGWLITKLHTDTETILTRAEMNLA